MSWTRGDFIFPENTGKNEMMAEIIDSLSEERGKREPIYMPFTLHKGIEPFKSEKEARKYMAEKGWDCDRDNGHGVRFLLFEEEADSQKIRELNGRLAAHQAKFVQYVQEHSVKKLKAAYIGCPLCGSKLSREHLKTNYCPLCNADLHSSAVQAKILAYNEKSKNLMAKIEEEKEKINEKRIQKAKVCWLVYDYAYLG